MIGHEAPEYFGVQVPGVGGVLLEQPRVVPHPQLLPGRRAVRDPNRLEPLAHPNPLNHRLGGNKGASDGRGVALPHSHEYLSGSHALRDASLAVLGHYIQVVHARPVRYANRVLLEDEVDSQEL